MQVLGIVLKALYEKDENQANELVELLEEGITAFQLGFPPLADGDDIPNHNA